LVDDVKVSWNSGKHCNTLEVRQLSQFVQWLGTSKFMIHAVI
jgi:hypothetical protein